MSARNKHYEVIVIYGLNSPQHRSANIGDVARGIHSSTATPTPPKCERGPRDMDMYCAGSHQKKQDKREKSNSSILTYANGITSYHRDTEK